MRLTWLASGALSLLLMLSASPSQGALILTMESSDSLLNLQVGDMITVDVRLTGVDDLLTGGTTIDVVLATVDMIPGLFGTPAMSVGPIVPGSLVLLNPAPSQADFFYIDDQGNNLIGDGILFSFSVTAVAAGAGAIKALELFDGSTGDQLYPVAYGLLNGIPLDPIPITVSQPNGLDFTISAQPSAIPEPSTAVLFGVMGLTVAGWSRFRRRSAQRQGH